MGERTSLVQLDLKNFQGIYSKSSPDVLNPEQLDIAENTDLFKYYGAAGKLKGNRRILSAIYKEANVTKPISWVGFYKESDLDGQILRHTLVAAGTTIQRVNLSTGALTSLKTGRTSGLYHVSSIMDKFLLISNQDPDRIGLGDEMIKYDGLEITRWGVVPPGSQEDGTTVAQGKVVENFSSLTNLGVTAQGTVALDTTTTWDGTAISLSKTGTGAVDASLIGAITTAGSPNTAVADRVGVYIFIPRGQLKNFQQSNSDPNQAITLRFSSDTGAAPYEPTTNYYEYYFKIGTLVEGWNHLLCSFVSAPTGSVGASSGTFTGTVNTIKFTINANAASTLITGIRFSHLVFNDQGTIVATPAAGGSLGVGDYTYKVSFLNKYGNESNVGPMSVAATTTGSLKTLNLANLPISNDPNVVARKIYRTVAGGTVWLLLATVNDNITTTYADTLGDSSLSVITAPQAGDFSSDYSPPPKCGIIKVWKKTVFLAGDPLNPSTLYFSNDTLAESFPLINTFELDAKITGIYETYSGLVIETENGKWQALGDNPDFAVDKIIEGMGNVGRRAVGTARMIGWSVDRDCMRLFDLSDTKKISEPIRDKYDNDINKTNIEFIHTVHYSRNNSILQFNPNGSGVYDSIFMYQYGLDDVKSGWWTTVNTPAAANLNFLSSVEAEDADGTKVLLVGGYDGMLYQLFHPDDDNWVDANGTKYPIKQKIQTPYIRMMSVEGATSSNGLSGRVQPRMVELRVEGDPTTYTVTLAMAKGISQTTPTDTQTLTFTFGANESIKRIPTRELTAWEYVRVTVENEDLDVDTVLLAIRIYSEVRPGQFAIE